MDLIERLLKGSRDSYPQLDLDELATLEAFLSLPSNRPSLADLHDQSEFLHDREWLKGTLEYNRKRRRWAAEAKPKDLGPSDDSLFLSARDIADKWGLDYERLRKKLERWRSKNTAGADFIEAEDTQPGSPQFLYRIGAIRSIIESLQTP